MCIAIVAPKGKIVPTEVLARAFQGNRDGAGFAYIRKGEVVIDKGYMELGRFLAKYQELKKMGIHTKSPMLIHCRIATIGKVGPDNCHPFRLRDGAVIHNGSLWYEGGRNDVKSDTRIFAERLHNALRYDDIIVDKAKLENVLGFDKMAFLFKNGEYVILNEHRGRWHEDVWYSHGGPLNTGWSSNWRDTD